MTASCLLTLALTVLQGLGHGNLSKVFRVKVSIKSGRCKLQDGTQVEQVHPTGFQILQQQTPKLMTPQTVKYFHGIGVDKKPIDKFNDGITGDGCKEQIAAVFKVSRVIKCHQHPLTAIRNAATTSRKKRTNCGCLALAEVLVR